MHTYVHPALLSDFWDSPKAPPQRDVLTSGRVLVGTSLYLGYIRQPTICLLGWLHPEQNYPQGSLRSKLQTPTSKGIKEMHDPALPLPSMGEGLCPCQQGVLASDSQRILQLVLETLEKICVWRSQCVTFSSSKAAVGGERPSLTHQRHTLIKVWTPRHSLHLPFQWAFSLKLQMFTGMKDKDFLRTLCKTFECLLIPPFSPGLKRSQFGFQCVPKNDPTEILRCLQKDIKSW